MATSVKNRAWVKNAAIIFLAVMLVLTLFSNTIMNHALPEVAAQYATSGTITSKVRATAAVKANMTFDVTAEETRVVDSVAVKTGDMIEAGGVLYYLKDEESEELKAAQKTLEELQLAYEKALLALPVPDYSADERDIREKKEDLALLQKQKNEVSGKDGAVKAAQAAVDAAQDWVDELTEKQSDINEKISELGDRTPSVRSYKAAVTEAEKALKAAQEELEKLKSKGDIDEAAEEVRSIQQTLEDQQLQLVRLQEDLEQIVAEDAATFRKLSDDASLAYETARHLIYGDNRFSDLLDPRSFTDNASILKEIQDKILSPFASTDSDPVNQQTGQSDSVITIQLPNYTEEEANKYYNDVQNALIALDTASAALEAYKPAETTAAQRAIEDQQIQIDRTMEKLYKAQDKYNAVQGYASEKTVLEANVDACQTALDQAQDAYDAALENANAELKNQMDEVKTKLRAANRSLSDAQQRLSKAQGEAGGSAEDFDRQILAQERAIEAAQAALDRKKEDDLLKAKQDDLDIEAQEKQIEEQKAAVEKYKAAGSGATVTSQYGGLVSSLSAVAGDTISIGSTVAVIEVVEKGYSLEFPVTNEQAKLIRAGDVASLNSWWYSDITVTVKSLKNDPANPGKGRIVVCDVAGGSDGSVTVGQNLSVVLGERGASYDIVVPNSAIREDSNGKFVLVVESRPGPLSNRYIATRADITVVASDDNSSAISGALYGSEFIITTSTKPIEAGQQVRLVEN